MPPAVTDVPTVRLPPITFRSIRPSAVVALVNVASPLLSTEIDPVPVVRLVNVAALALTRSILPLTVSALIEVPSNCSDARSPIPVPAFRSIVAAVISPVPLTEPVPS